jgi:hypothetical protein
MAKSGWLKTIVESLILFGQVSHEIYYTKFDFHENLNLK